MTENSNSTSNEVHKNTNTSSTQSEKNLWPMFCHASQLISFLIPILGGIIAVLLIWLIKKDKDQEVDFAGRAIFNFNLSLLIYLLGLFIFMMFGFSIVRVLQIGGILSPSVTLLMFSTFLLAVLGLVIIKYILVFIAMFRTNRGTNYIYPFCFMFAKLPVITDKNA